KRLLYVLPTIFLVTVMVFSLLQLVPGDPVDALMGEETDPEIRNALIVEMGLDQPLHIQYFTWMSKVVQGDLGHSLLHGQPVGKMISEALPRTMQLAAAAMVVALVIALPLGIFAAVKRKTIVDYTAQVVAMIGLSMPVFWEALLLMFLFALILGWFPAVGYTAPSKDFWDFLHHLSLPAITLGFELVAVITRMTRSTMLEELNKDYVQTHRSQGLSENVIIGRYTLKNAMIPTLTIVSIRMAALMGGTIVIEQVFAWPGIGLMILDAIHTKDYPLIQGGVLIVSFTFVFVNLIVDILYKWLDPRIKLE
ncbi:MAG: ABC transporter permease, partial [Deltaproteobacteria bacterium]|nr:ABC transporter permease [Deltaproteobacteria bacterium]